MGLKNDFSNAVRDKKYETPKLTKLTVLQKDDKNTIFNLIFSEKSEKEETAKP